MDSILDLFYKFLIGPDVNRDAESCIQEIGDLRRICIAIKTKSFKDLFEKNRLRDKYLFEYCVDKEYAGETIKKYPRTVLTFCTFLISEEILIHDISTDEALRMKLKVAAWIKQQGDKCKIQRWEREEETLNMLIDSKHLQIYQKSDHAVLARNLFSNFQTEETSPVISRGEYCCICMRDHLFVEIHFGNGNRSRVTANMLLHEFKNARKQCEFYIVHVRNHKIWRWLM